jgi:uncharacterized membrane protein YfcA
MRGGKLMLLGAVAASMLGANAARAHNDWALPLLGGAVGGYALKSYLGSREKTETVPVEPVYVSPRPTYVAPPPSPTASVEARLRELDSLAANGYITHQEYEQRRQAILNGI